MDQNITVTIGVPFHNADRFLDLSIRSVLSQTFKSFELILTDDGSTDDSLHIAKSFNDPRILILSDGKNKGISYRLNEQISLAKGKYFIRMDADDIMFPDRLEKQINYLESHENIDVLGADIVIIDNENTIIGYRESPKPKTLVQAFKSTAFFHPTVAGKTDWFKSNKYNLALNGCEDHDLWIRSFRYSNFNSMDEPVLFYRDPNVFKLKTYLFRQRQIRKMYITNGYLLKNKSLILCFVLNSYIKSFAAIISNIFRLDKKILTRRNQYVPIEQYATILDNIKLQ